MNRRGQVNPVSGSKLTTQLIDAHAEALTGCATMSLWETEALSLESYKGENCKRWKNK